MPLTHRRSTRAKTPLVVTRNTPVSDLPEELTVSETAAFLGVSLTTAHRLVAAGELPAVRVGQRLLRVHKESVVRLLTGGAR